MKGKEALFSLENYSITECSFNLNGVSSMDKLCLDFNPSGFYNQDHSTYELQLEITVTFGDSKIINTKLHAIYKFKEPLELESIPDFFYSNCIAIVFPYIRAFISTVTLQANVKPVIIPTLNIQPLGEVLKTNTQLK